MVIAKTLEAITWADIEQLAIKQTSEGRRLEFKLELPSGRDADTKELLADLTSFANSDGGDLIIGIRDEGGTAGEIVGIDARLVDGAVLRLDNIARDGVDPRLAGLRIHSVVNGDRAVLIIRVPASFAAPHRVTYKGTSRFYARNSRGKFEMDTHELRQAFVASEEAPRRLRDLHERTQHAAAGENMPAKLVEGPSVLVTVAPISILREKVDLAFRREDALLPPEALGGLDILNGFEGVVVLAGRSDSHSVGAFSVNHRSGYMSAGWSIGRVRNDERFVWPKYVVQSLPGFVASAITRLREHGLGAPWIVMVTLTGVKGFRLIISDHYWSETAWQDKAYLGDIIFDDLQSDTLQPFTDGFARLFGIDPNDAGKLPW